MSEVRVDGEEEEGFDLIAQRSLTDQVIFHFLCPQITSVCSSNWISTSTGQPISASSPLELSLLCGAQIVCDIFGAIVICPE